MPRPEFKPTPPPKPTPEPPRRATIAAAAWTVPTILLAVAAPAAAVTGNRINYVGVGVFK